MILKIIYRNLVHKPLNGLLSLALLTLSVAIISLLIVTGRQVSEKLDKDLQGIDMVVGAKGSPLQLVLSAVYHIDAPTGNISKKDADNLTRNPMIETAIPLSYGDSYKGYRLLGTTPGFLTLYNATLQKGNMYEASMEVVAGAKAAFQLGLKPGDTFFSNHGEDARGKVHTETAYRVTGILHSTGSVIDQLLLTSTQSIWDIHEEDLNKDNENEKKEAHNHESKEEEHEGEDERHITALLIKFRSPMGIMMLPRMINEETKMQAAVPTLEIKRLINLMGIGITTLQGIAFAIMSIAGLSVFVSLYNRLKERQFEHALMRSMGTSRGVIFMLLVAEGLLLSIVGFFAGLALCRVGLMLLNTKANEDFKFSFSYQWAPEEWYLFGITILIGILAAIIPAIKAYLLNIAKTLSNG